MRTEYVDHGSIIAVVYALKEVLHLQILTGNQEHKWSQQYSDHIYHLHGRFENSNPAQLQVEDR